MQNPAYANIGSRKAPMKLTKDQLIEIHEGYHGESEENLIKAELIDGILKAMGCWRRAPP